MKKKIDQIKKNKGIGSHPPFLAGDFLHWQSVFEDYKKRGIQPDLEYVRLILVSIVSLFESFYKEIFSRYIDFGEPYLSRAEQLHNKNKPEISFEILKGLSKNIFTLGDIYAYTLRYNSLNQIRENYEILTGEDYLSRIKNASIKLDGIDASEVERAKANATRIFRLMDNVFVMRHSLVHEYPAEDAVVMLDELLEYLDCGWLLLMTTDRLYWADTMQIDPFRTAFPPPKLS